MKQEELNKAASRGGFDYVDGIVQENPGHRWNDHDIEYGYRDGFLAGYKLAMEQMLKEAVEGEFMLNPYPIICLNDCKDYDFKDGDKVRIIIVKEDEK